MPLSVATLKRQVRDLDFDFLGETVHVTYRPGLITTEADSWPMPKWIATILESWDLLADDGQVYPLEEAALSKLPDSFLVALGKAVFGNSRLDPSTSAISADG